MRRLHGKVSPRLTGLPYLADRTTRLGGSPHLSSKCDQDKTRSCVQDNWDTWMVLDPWDQV